MKFYSDLTKRIYESAEECQEAEFEYNAQQKRKEDERKAREAEMEKKNLARERDKKEIEAMEAQYLKNNEENRKLLNKIIEKKTEFNKKYYKDAFLSPILKIMLGD